MGKYRLIHVRGGNEIARYMIRTIETNGNPCVTSNITPLHGFTTFEQFVSAVKSGNANMLDIPSGMLGVRESTQVIPSLINGLTTADIIYLLSDTGLQANDRFYLDRWDANHSYINISSISGSTVYLQYYCYDGTLAYTTSMTSSESSIQGGTYILPWLGDFNNFGNGALTTFGIYLDTRDNGLFKPYNAGVSPTSLANAQKFWGKVKPADNIDTTDTLGGGGSYDFEGDDIPMPDAPDETVSGVLASGFLNIYSPSAQNLQDFGQALWTNAFNVKWYDVDSLANLVLNAVSDPINFIIGLFMLPVSPTTGSSSGIYLGGINVNTVSVPRVTGQYVTVDFGTIDIDELYGSYLDYSYSRLSIYLPYIGMADIDVQEVTGGSVTLRYIIDCFTGACVANVRCVKNTPTPWGSTYSNKSVHSYSGNVAIQLPISAGSFDIMTQGLINVGLGLVSGQPQTVAKGATDIIQSVGGDATTRGALSSNTGKLCYQTPYLMFTRPIETRPAKLGNLHGFSAGRGGLLSTFSGYVECTDVKLDGVTATDTELNEIETLLKTGVYV